MKKIYENPMLEVVSIKMNDVIATSDPALTGTYTGGEVLAPERNMFDVEGFYQGY